MKQNISLKIRGGIHGYIEYNDTQTPPKVVFNVVLKGHPLDRQNVIDYLTTVKSFEIPQSSVVTDQYEIFRRKPTSQIDYFELALSEMGLHVGVFLHK